jgi:hypothetical protein
MLEKYSKCVGCDEEEEMVGNARRTENPRAALEAMKNKR